MTDTHVQHHRPEPQHGPVEQGETLLSLERNRGAERLRVSLETYNGYEFVRLQVWEVNGQGEWWPIRGKNVTIKIHETGQLAAVLANLAREHGAVVDSRQLGRRQDPRPGSRGSSRWGGASRPQQRALPGPGTSAGSEVRNLDQGPPFEATRPTRPFTEFDGDE